MVRAFGLSALFSFFGLVGFAQQDSAEVVPQARLATHYIGIQANQLFKQLFSLSSSSTAINNPYLVTYSVNSTSTQVGLNLSVGFTFSETKDGDGSFERETKISDVFFRIGIEKKSSLGKRWILSCGGDLVIDNQINETKTTSSFGGSTTETNNKTSGIGLGPRVTLNFQVSEKIYIGTEANYYFKSIKTTSEVKPAFGVSETDTSKFKRFQLNVPAVIFLIIKL